MGVTTSNTAAQLQRTSGGIGFSALNGIEWAAKGFVRATSFTGDWRTIFSLCGATQASQHLVLECSDTGVMEMYLSNDSQVIPSGPNVGTTQHKFIHLRVTSGGSATLSIGNAEDNSTLTSFNFTITAAQVTYNVTQLHIGHNPVVTNEDWQGNHRGWAFWYGSGASIWNAGDIDAERRSFDPARAGAVAAYRMLNAATAGTDSTGNSRTLTTANLTDATDPTLLGGSDPTISGTPVAPTATASGSIRPMAAIAGTTTAPVPTITGALSPASQLSGNLTAPGPISAGTLQTLAHLSGATLAPIPSASGSLSLAVRLTGTVVAPFSTTAGNLSPIVSFAGGVAASSPTVVGTLLCVVGLSGTVTVSVPSSSGLLQPQVSGGEGSIFFGTAQAPAPGSSGLLSPVIVLSGATVVEESTIMGLLMITVSGGSTLSRPTVSGITPAPGTGLGAIQPLSFDVVDVDGDLGRVLIAIQYENYEKTTDLAWDGDNVVGPYKVSFVPIPNGLRYTIFRNRGWLGPFTLRVFATDLLGNEV